MSKTTPRLLALLILMLAGIGIWHEWQKEATPATTTESQPRYEKPILPSLNAPPERTRSPIAAQTKAVALPEKTQKKDKYEGRKVIAQTESIEQVGGIKTVKRVRLVEDPSFKYPLIRVEDELIRDSQGERLTRQVSMVGDHVLIKLSDPKMSEADFLAELKSEGVTIRKKMPASKTWLVAFAKPDLDTVPEWVKKLSQMKGIILYAEPDYIVSTLATPNDPEFGTLWNLHNTGQFSSKVDADIDAPEGWAYATGSKTVKVGILDSGMDLTHPDLQPNLWINPNEIPNNGIDDDGNGYVDDVHGWDFAYDDASPQDDHGHGSHCAGTLGAAGNNGIGITGVAWNVSLIPLKFLNSSGNGFNSDAIEALAYATDIGVTLTSNSWGGDEFSQLMMDTIEEANQAGILMIAASGNDGLHMEMYSQYPGGYTNENIITVGATTRFDEMADFSNYGPVSVDLAAPGHEIYSAAVGGGYRFDSGTSMACPHVAGACAVLKAFKPELTGPEIRHLILKSVDVLPSLVNKTVTGGKLNLHNAILASDDVLLTPAQGFVSEGPQAGPFIPLSKDYRITNYTTRNQTWTASFDKSWVGVSPTSGTLSPGESMALTVTLNSQTQELPTGDQTATLTVLNPGTSRQQKHPILLKVDPLPIHIYTLDTDPGWPRDGEWQFGKPQGQGATYNGYPDPKSGASGNNVLGINIAGDYAVQEGAPQYLTAGPFDLSQHHSTELRFQRWFNSDYQPYVYAAVQVSSDNSTWYTVWQNGSSADNENAWTRVKYDISAYADNQSQVYIRWVHHIPFSGSYPYSGMNLDDIQIMGSPNLYLTLTTPLAVTEGESATQAKISVYPAPTSDLTISLTSDRPGQELVFPTTVVIPAGSLEISFNISAMQDSLIDGTQKVQLTATASEYPAKAVSILVHDDEQGALTLTLPNQLTEGAGDILNQATLSLGSTAAADITVQLQSNDVTELKVPETVTIPLGQSQVSIPLNVPDDDIIDGPQTVTVTASVTNWPQAQSTLTVLDNEARNLTVILPAVRRENAGMLHNEGEVRVSGILATPLTVTLHSSDTGELVVPETVLIQAGTSFSRFHLTPQNDEEPDGDQTVTVTASGTDFTSGNSSMIIADVELPALPANPLPTLAQNPVRPDTRLSWEYDPHTGEVPDSYQILFGTTATPTEVLGTTATASWSLPAPGLSISTTYYWQVVSRKGTATRTGPIWSFTTSDVGPVHQFAWDTPPSVIGVDVPQPVRVTALDEFGNTLVNFTSRVNISAEIEQPESLTGTGSYAWVYPLATKYHDARSQIIYKPEEIGPAGSLTAIALEVVLPPGQSMSQLTIRLKHTNKNDYVAEGLSWEDSGWTTVHASDRTVSEFGWTWFNFSTPFEYNGTQNLMVDFSYNNDSYSTDGTTRTTITGSEYRTLAYRTDSVYGAPTGWSGTLPEPLAYNGLPNLRVRRQSIPVSVAPGFSGTFVKGSWSGQVRLLEAGSQIKLRASDRENTAITGLSAPFNVVEVDPFILLEEPAFTGGLSNVIQGQPLSSEYEYEIQRAARSDFGDAISSGFLSTPEHTFSGLSDGQRYYYRGRSRRASAFGKWSDTQASTQDATPPTVTFTPRSGGLTDHNILNLNGVAHDSTSGVLRVTVDDLDSLTTNSFSTWDAPFMYLRDGLNTKVITVKDKAVPPNITHASWNVMRLTFPESDDDDNGVPLFLEYAFNASGTEGANKMPVATIEKHSETQQLHLVLSYQRLIHNPAAITYQVETASTLKEDWVPLAQDPEVLSITPTGDEITETVKLRIHPSLEGQPRRFARIRVIRPEE